MNFSLFNLLNSLSVSLKDQLHDQRVCPSTRECLQLITEGTETTGTRETVNQGRLCTHTHSPEKAYHKKEWVEAENTRIPSGRGNPTTKQTPADKKRRR